MAHCFKNKKLHLLVRWNSITIEQSEYERGLTDKNHWISQYRHDIQRAEYFRITDRKGVTMPRVTIRWKQSLVPIENFKRGQPLFEYLSEHKLENHWNCLIERTK